MLIARVVLDEPIAKDELASAPTSNGAPRSPSYLGPADLLEAIVSLTDDGRVSCRRACTTSSRHMLFEESMNAIVAVMRRQSPATMRSARIEDFSKIQLDPWPAGGSASRTSPIGGSPRTLVPPRRADNNGYTGRSKAWSSSSTWRHRSARGRRTSESYRSLPTRAAYFPADNAPPRAPGCAARHRRNPKDPASPSTAMRSRGNDGRSACRWIRTKVSSCTPSATRTAAVCGPILHRASRQRDGASRTGTRAAARLEATPSTPANSGLGRIVNSLALGCDCLGEIRYLDAVFPTARRARDDRQRHLHPRGGLRHPLEALGHAG